MQKIKSIRLLALTGSAVALTSLLVPAPAHAQNLYIGNDGNNTVSEYDATIGGPAIPTFNPAGVDGPGNLALSGNDLYVSNYGNNTVGEYNATTGAAIATFVNPVGLDDPNGLAVSGVPEPSSWALLGLGGAALLGLSLRPRPGARLAAQLGRQA
jgi:hypothetical protein